MITFTQGNIFESEATALVNPVNCVGIMGRGLALQFKRKYPNNFERYCIACARNQVRPGQAHVFRVPGPQSRWIVNFPTKRHWRHPSQIEDIDSGLLDLSLICRSYPIPSIAIPPLGCGLGGLPWPDVKRLIVRRLENLESTRVLVYEPRTARS